MALPVDKTFCLKMYEQMLTIRSFEEKAIELFEHNLIRGNIHPCIGQEGISVGVCSFLRRDDYMLNTHRGHGNCIAKRADLKLMMADFLDAPVQRVGALNVPIPYSEPLEHAVIPNEVNIAKAVKKVLYST
jgi:TPP-dependent pyruvate/acetoin dehydrogenase alpha subunit